MDEENPTLASLSAAAARYRLSMHTEMERQVRPTQSQMFNDARVSVSYPLMKESSSSRRP